MAPERDFDSADHRVCDFPPSPAIRQGFVPDEHSGPAPQPFRGRFLRAVALVIVAVMAHVWLVRAPRGDEPVPAIQVAEALIPALRGEAAAASNAPDALESVTIETRLVAVGTSGVISPAQTRARRREPAPEGPAREPAGAARAPAVAEAVAISAAKGSDGSDVVQAEHESGPASGDGTSEADVALSVAPLAAARRPPAMVTRISGPVASTARTPERVITAAPIVEPDQKALVSRVLQQYAAAYGRLDAGAAKLVYPAVDESALRRAFRQLETQRVTFESCGITISGSGANARCQGEAAYRPRVGPRSLQRASREWTFDLAKADDGWRIVKARVR